MSTRLFLMKKIYAWGYRFSTWLLPPRMANPRILLGKKNLIAIAVGAYGEPYVQKILTRLGSEKYDFLLFVWDDNAKLSHDVFKKAKIIREKGCKFQFAKKYITEEVAHRYEHIFLWDDDVDVEDFSFENFLDIFRRNRLELAQPALSDNSFYSFDITKRVPAHTGRFTDFVEIMVPVFTPSAWLKYSQMIDLGWNLWAWGTDNIAKTFCGYRRMGIIDTESVRHMKEIITPAIAALNHKQFLEMHPQFQRARMITYAHMR